MPFQRAFTGARWESEIGYCRALRHEHRIFVTGTASVDEDGSVHGLGDGYAQARRCLQIIERALGELGGAMHHVARTRMFVTDISRWEEYGRAHAEVFQDHPPTTTMVEVTRLIHPDMLIEIEADALLPS